MKIHWANFIGGVMCLLLFLFIGAILFPIFVKVHPVSKMAVCHSNLNLIGRAFMMYLDDWDNTYPTNRIRLKNRKLGSIRGHIKLSAKLGSISNPGDKFRNGVNWVEALHPYIEAVKSNTDSLSKWRCKVVSDETYPTNSDTACVTYVYNRNMAEKQEGIVTNAANLMLAREADRLVNADLRPLNDSTGSPNKMPVSAFLNKRDVKMGKTNTLLHGRGSHILFVDAHVAFFDIAYFPSKPQWDPETRQWYNFANSQNPSLNKSIAITP